MNVGGELPKTLELVLLFVRQCVEQLVELGLLRRLLEELEQVRLRLVIALSRSAQRLIGKSHQI